MGMRLFSSGINTFLGVFFLGHRIQLLMTFAPGYTARVDPLAFGFRCLNMKFSNSPLRVTPADLLVFTYWILQLAPIQL